MTTSLQDLPIGTELADQNGKHWTLEALKTPDDQVILYEAEPTIVVLCESKTQEQRLPLKLDSNEQNFFSKSSQTYACEQVEEVLGPALAIPICISFGIH